MDTWFSGLDTFQKIYWSIALIGSAMFVIIMVLTLIGGDTDDMGDADAEVDGDAGIDFQFLTLKNLVAFFTIFGWSGIAFLDEGWSRPLVVLVSTICGLIMMLIMASIFYYLSKLTHSGTLNVKNAKDAVGEVYLTIGANRSKIGKVHVRVQGSLRELEALTDEPEDLNMGNVIKVKEVTDNGILIVEKLKS